MILWKKVKFLFLLFKLYIRSDKINFSIHDQAIMNEICLLGQEPGTNVIFGDMIVMSYGFRDKKIEN